MRPTPGSPPLESGYYRRSRALPLLSVGLALAPALPVFAASVPHAYLRLLVYTADSVLMDSKVVTLSSAAKNNYEQLQARVIVPPGGAYVLAYVGNESEEVVYFDDISVEHRQGLLVQETQYDPYGLELAGLSRSRAPETLNKYTFNGKEKQTEFGLGWHDHGWRFYDPALGRWVVTDPDAEKGDQFGWGTYQFGMDNAVRYNDLDGLCPTCEQDGRKADNLYTLGATIESQGRSYVYTGNGTYGETLGSKLASANAAFDASLEGHSNPTNNEGPASDWAATVSLGAKIGAMMENQSNSMMGKGEQQAVGLVLEASSPNGLSTGVTAKKEFKGDGNHLETLLDAAGAVLNLKGATYREAVNANLEGREVGDVTGAVNDVVNAHREANEIKDKVDTIGVYPASFGQRGARVITIQGNTKSDNYTGRSYDSFPKKYKQ